ncbi:MAG: ferrous iron transport protein A [Bifidobacteriaceae bacterium]|jgi:Fe2+ transport system protein FeoA|nr:ferrous iron transport protein A [Bifidobacteriaceae bacterium]
MLSYVKLTEAPLGAPLRIEKAALDGQTALRLCEIGLRPGCVVCVMQRTVFGGTVVMCGGHRLALDKATAASVTTSLITSSTASTASALAGAPA